MLNELTKRRVFRVLSGYAVVCFVLLQIADVTFGPLGIDESVLRIVITVMLVALPAVGYVGWILDVEPNSKARRMQTGHPWVEASIAIAAIGLVSGISWFTLFSDDSVATEDMDPMPDRHVEGDTLAVQEKSVAVLPFTDMSETKDQEYFGDGMAEEIISLLTKVSDLRVAARTSSFYFKEKPGPIKEIASKLAVAQILQGSVRRAGDRLRITAQLVQADNGYVVWAETYDRNLSDVFALQDEIANAVVDALQIKFMGGKLTRREGGTQNLEAYQLYLRGISAHRKNTLASLDSAEKYLQQAIEIDPNYSRALAALAFTFTTKADSGFLNPSDGFERARHLSQRALRVSQSLSEAHANLSYIYRTFDWNWSAAQAEARLALAQDPTNPNALIIAGMLSYSLGRWETAEQQLRLALVRDPLNTYALWNLGVTYYGAGRYEDSEEMYRKLLEIEPEFVWINGYLGKTLLAQGRPEAALEVIKQGAVHDMQLSFLPIALHAVGRDLEAREALNKQIELTRSEAYETAQCFAFLGERTLAFEWLERAYIEKSTSVNEILGEPLMANIVDDPRYDEFLKKMNLPLQQTN